MDAQAPHCDIHKQPMELAFSVPMDVLRKVPNPFSEVYECVKCGYGCVYPLPAADQISSFYKFDYYTHGAGTSLTTARPSGYDRLRVHLAWRLDRGIPMYMAVRTLLAGNKNKTLCDLGAGRGDLSTLFASQGYKVTAIDPDPNALSTENQGKFEFYPGSAEQLPSSVLGRKFDIVLMSHVLEHCIDPMRALINVRSILRRGGKIICEVPNNDAMARRWHGAAWNMLDVPRHLHFFTSKSLSDFAAQAGFRSIDISYSQYLRQFSNDYIQTERNHFEVLSSGVRQPYPALTINSKWRAWQLLLCTAFAQQKYKYDSVRVIATN